MTDSKNTTKEKKNISKKMSNNLETVIYSQKGENVGSIELPMDIFGLKWNADLVHEVVVGMMANKRAGTAHTKDRSEVSGGGKKPWKQKGTGRARHGSTRSPIWVGGGVTFGPRNDKDYSKKINKKTRVKALYTILSRKYKLGTILFVDNISLPEIKTKNAQGILNDWSKIDTFEKINTKKKTGTLMVVPELNETTQKSFANLSGVTLMTAAELNAMLLMKFRHIVLIDPKTTIPVLAAKKK